MIEFILLKNKMEVMPALTIRKNAKSFNFSIKWLIFEVKFLISDNYETR